MQNDSKSFTCLEVESMEEANEELMEDIETALVDLLRKKQDLYRQHGGLINQMAPFRLRSLLL